MDEQPAKRANVSFKDTLAHSCSSKEAALLLLGQKGASLTGVTIDSHYPNMA